MSDREWEPTAHIRIMNKIFLRPKGRVFFKGRNVTRSWLEQRWQRVNIEQTGYEYEWRVFPQVFKTVENWGR